MTMGMHAAATASAAKSVFTRLSGCLQDDEVPPGIGVPGRRGESAAPAIRSVVRAVELLRALNLRPVSTLDFLHGQTGLPKPSIVRMMQTLQRCGLVQHAPQHGAYYLSSGVLALSHGFHSEPMIVEASASLLDAVTLRLKWPLAIAMLEDFSMVVRYSTIPLSPLALRHSTLNVKLSLVSRAIGRAYLAFCPPDQQAALLHALALSENPEDEQARDADAVRAVLDEVRSRGFAMRHPGVWPASNTLAVPVFGKNGVACSLGMTYFSSTMSPAQAVERYLPELQTVAREIEHRLMALQAAGNTKKPEPPRRSRTRQPARAAPVA
ncbi:MAG: DNA-binding transcriptional regulator [Polaromonas sp.]|nr:DNA-binding transcriptional regulator [Polaromonas sp.]